MAFASALLIGLLLAWPMGQLYYPIALRVADGDDEEPTPPMDAPERSPRWCHSHGMPLDDEEN